MAIPSKVDNAPINTSIDPIQIDYTIDEQKKKTFLSNVQKQKAITQKDSIKTDLIN